MYNVFNITYKSIYNTENFHPFYVFGLCFVNKWRKNIFNLFCFFSLFHSFLFWFFEQYHFNINHNPSGIISLNKYFIISSNNSFQTYNIATGIYLGYNNNANKLILLERPM